MATSLAQQLAKLSVPQTTLLTKDKKRASLLFDPKEAATLTREAVYLIGKEGFEELLTLNQQAFQTFASTLFGDKSKDLERAVETSELNNELNKNIRKFLCLLSPYFLQRSTHKALEWLIHRFHVHEYNIDELIFLALPYHETNIFVRVLQVIKLKNNDKWLWLKPLQRPGVHLPKSTLFTHAASNASFLNSICYYTLKTLKINQYANVNSLISFYCTTFIGAIDYSEDFTEAQITSMLPAIMKSLASSPSNPDFTSATYMIVAKLIAKTPLANRLLNNFTEYITLFKTTSLKIEATLLLIIIYQHQVDYTDISDEAFLNIAEKGWFPSVVQELITTGSRVQPLLKVLIAKGMQMAAAATENGEAAQKLVKNLVNLKIDCKMVPHLIRSILTIYDPICPAKVHSFFADLLKTFEIQYPNQFDDTVNDIMLNSNNELQEHFKLLTRSDLDISWCTILEKLNNPLAAIRKESVEFLIKNYETYSSRNQNFFKSLLLNRLQDDENVEVIYECLIADKKLVSKIIERETLVELLDELLLKCLENKETHWQLVIPALDILCPVLTTEDYESLIVLLSFFKDGDMKVTKFIMDNISCYFEVINNAGKHNNFEYYLATNLSEANLLSVENIAAVITNNKLNKSPIFKATTIMLMVHLLKPNTPCETSKLVLEVLMDTQRNEAAKKPHYFQFKDKLELSLEKHLSYVERVFQNCHFEPTTLIDFSVDSTRNKFIVNVMDLLTRGLFYKKKYVSSYAEAFKRFLDKYASSEKNYLLSDKVILLLNVASAESSFISVDLQMRCMLIVQNIIESRIVETSRQQEEVVVIILLVLLKKSTLHNIKRITCSIISKISNNKFADLLKGVLRNKDEILLDSNQLGQILFNLKQSKQIELLTNYICDGKIETPLYLQATYFDITVLLTDIDMFEKTSNVARQFLDQTLLTQLQSQIVGSNINRLTPQIAADIKLNTNVWNFIESTILSDKDILQPTKSPSVTTMSMIDRNFYATLKPMLQNRLLDLIVTVTSTSDNADISSAATKVFKHIELDSAAIMPILTSMRDLQSQSTTQKRRSRRVSVIPTVDILSAESWRKGVCVLELIQDKKKFSNTVDLIPLLFELLKKCLDFDEQSNVEYPKQLILSSILHCCQKNTSRGVAQFSETAFNMSLIVQCMRTSWNPQTHHHTLVLLAHCATFTPNQVLQNIMAIFTFMGSSYLRHDDAYSFQIITEVIDTIIPILIRDDTLENVLSILGVFVDAVTDVPEHRRVKLYHQFLAKLNSEQYVSYFVLLVFKNHVKRANAEKLHNKNLLQQVPNRLEIAASLLGEFDAKTILVTVDHILKYLRELPVEKDDNKKDIIFPMKSYTTKEFRHYKYTIIQFVANLLSSPNFVVAKIASLTNDDLMSLEPVYKNLIIHELTYIQITTKVSEKNSSTPQAQYWKVILHHAYDILDSVNALLTPQMFLLVVKGLLTHSLATVRRRALELLNVKLQHSEDFFDDCEDAEFNDVIVSLVVIIKTVASDSLQSEQEVIVQTALLSMKLVTRLLAQKQPEKFVQLLSFITELIKCKNLNLNILASLILCLAELCNQLKMHSISNLNSFMPVVIKTLKSQRNIETPNLLLLSLVTALQKLMDCISLFLTPYLEKIICELTYLLTRWNGLQIANPILNKINLIWGKVGTSIQPRVLIPIIEASYTSLIEKKRFANVEPLMNLLAKNIEWYKTDVLESHVLDLTAFFLSALQFRTVNKNIEESNLVESHVMKVFVVLILKLSERSFRPLFYKLYDWALRCDDQSERAITFYNLTSEISVHLKGLFVLFAGLFLNNASTILDQCNTIKNEQFYYEDLQHNVLLLKNVLSTLNRVFEHDTQKFINKERFDVLMQPLVDQLANQLGGTESFKERAKIVLIPAIVHFAVATQDDSLWKQLNYQICLKMRNADEAIRIAAVECLTEIVKKIGDDFLPLLPETIPFLAELLEDEVEDVEKVTQKSIQEMEGILGEPLQKYF